MSIVYHNQPSGRRGYDFYNQRQPDTIAEVAQYSVGEHGDDDLSHEDHARLYSEDSNQAPGLKISTNVNDQVNNLKTIAGGAVTGATGLKVGYSEHEEDPHAETRRLIAKHGHYVANTPNGKMVFPWGVESKGMPHSEFKKKRKIQNTGGSDDKGLYSEAAEPERNYSEEAHHASAEAHTASALAHASGNKEHHKEASAAHHHAVEAHMKAVEKQHGYGSIHAAPHKAAAETHRSHRVYHSRMSLGDEHDYKDI